MGYFKELMIENEDSFFNHIEENGITVNGITFYNGDDFQRIMPDAYFEAFTNYINGLYYEE